MIPFHTKLAADLKELGLSQDAFAAMIGYKQATVSRWMSGNRTPHSKVQELVFARLQEVRDQKIALLKRRGKLMATLVINSKDPELNFTRWFYELECRWNKSSPIERQDITTWLRHLWPNQWEEILRQFIAQSCDEKRGGAGGKREANG